MVVKSQGCIARDPGRRRRVPQPEDCSDHTQAVAGVGCLHSDRSLQNYDFSVLPGKIIKVVCINKK